MCFKGSAGKRSAGKEAANNRTAPQGEDFRKETLGGSHRSLFLILPRSRGIPSQPAKASHCDQQRQGRAHTRPNPIQKGFVARLVLRRLYRL